MPRGRGEPADSGRAPERPSRLSRKVAAILRDIPRQRAALDAAMAKFGDDFDLDDFVTAATSSDPEALNLVAAVERRFEILQNYAYSLAQTGLAEARRLGAAGGAGSATPLEQLRELGVISAEMCSRFEDLQEVRDRQQHLYADVEPEEIQRAVLVLRKDMAAFADRFERWFSRLG